VSETLFKTEYRETAEHLPQVATEGVPLPEGDLLAERERAIGKLRLLWEERHFLLRWAVAGFLIGLLVAFAIPVRFTSTTQLMPPDTQPGQGLAMLAAAAGKAPSSLASMAGDLLGVKNTGDLFIGVLKSRTVQDALITKFDLRSVYWDSTWEQARVDLSRRTYLSVDRRSGIITIDVSDGRPERAASMALEYVAQLNRVLIESNTSAAHRERVFLEERLKAVKRDLEDAERDFSQFASKNTAIDIKEQGKAMVEAAATLQGHMIAAQSELEGLRQIYTDNNVRVKAVEARIAELKRQLEKLGGQDVSLVQGKQVADQKSDSLYPSIRKLPLLGVEYADLYRRAKVQEAVFEVLTQQYELARVQEAKETPSVKVLDPPNIPEKKSYPPRLLIMLFGTLLAFACGTTWILGAHSWEATDPADVRKAFVTEVWGDLRAGIARVRADGVSRAQVQRLRNWLRSGARPGGSDRAGGGS